MDLTVDALIKLSSSCPSKTLSWKAVEGSQDTSSRSERFRKDTDVQSGWSHVDGRCWLAWTRADLISLCCAVAAFRGKNHESDIHEGEQRHF